MPEIERNIVPEEYQARLTEVGGVNRFDEPNFLLVWAQGGDEHATFTAGGCWTVEEASIVGYRKLLKGSNQPCWTLLQWHSPEEYGTPEMYYMQNLDEATGLQILGEYPYSGRYEVLYNLGYLDRKPEGSTEFVAMPLCGQFLDQIMPLILMAQDLSIEKKKAFDEDMREREERSRLSEIERHMRDAALPFRGANISYTRQGVRTPVIDRKVRNMQRNWNELCKAAKQLKPGIQTASSDPFSKLQEHK